jgi:transcriptional regulator with GAF, ATPase, and Fis domain
VSDASKRLLEQRDGSAFASREGMKYAFDGILGSSPALRAALTRAARVIPHGNVTVLLQGETGTGKELFARAIHYNGPRAKQPFVDVNCTAIPENLLESELFGHEAGAFTDARTAKPGLFELADGGTLFLDEIAEVPLTTQAKLLRVLQEHEFERVGDTHTRKVNVRIIAATNRDLKLEVEERRFRQDLFYRLSVFPIDIPPLRERRDDIPPLAAHFVKQTARRMNRPAPRVTPATLSQLAAHGWPGNVRELQNAVERAVILSQGGPLLFELPKKSASGSSRPPEAIAPSPVLTRNQLKRHERDSIAAALELTSGKVFGPGGAAELLGMKPTTLASRIKVLGLKRRTASLAGSR